MATNQYDKNKWQKVREGIADLLKDVPREFQADLRRSLNYFNEADRKFDVVCQSKTKLMSVSDRCPACKGSGMLRLRYNEREDTGGQEVTCSLCDGTGKQ